MLGLFGFVLSGYTTSSVRMRKRRKVFEDVGVLLRGSGVNSHVPRICQLTTGTEGGVVAISFDELAIQDSQILCHGFY